MFTTSMGGLSAMRQKTLFDCDEPTTLCPIHSAAPQMAAALLEVVKDMERAARQDVIWTDTQRMITAALTKAGLL